MPEEKKYVVPLVPKIPVTIVVLSSDNEAHALRAMLEGFNYRVDVIWVGSRAEFVEILKGNIEANEYLILSCHGIKEGIYVSDEAAVSPKEIGEIANLKNKIVLNLGCSTGTEEYKNAFVDRAGVKTYIAPGDYPEGDDALLFGIHFFYELRKGKDVEKAYEQAKSLHEEMKMFKLFK